MAAGDLNIIAGTSSTNSTVDLLAVGPGGGTVQLSELGPPVTNFDAFQLSNPGQAFGAKQLNDLVTARCDRRERTFRATVSPNLVGTSAVRTQSCRKRFIFSLPRTGL